MHARASRIFALVFTFAFVLQSAATFVLPAAVSAQTVPPYDPNNRQAFSTFQDAVNYCAGSPDKTVVRPDSLYTSQTYTKLYKSFYLKPNSKWWGYPGAGASFYCLTDALKAGWKDADDPSQATIAIDRMSYFNLGPGYNSALPPGAQTPTATASALPSSVGPQTSYADAQKICNGPVVWQLTQMSNMVAKYAPNQPYTTFWAQPGDTVWENRNFGDQYQCLGRIPSPSIPYSTLAQNASYGKALQCVGSYNSCDPATKAMILYFCSTNAGVCPANVAALLQAPSESAFNQILQQAMPAASAPPATSTYATPTPPPAPVNVSAPGYSTGTRQSFGQPDQALAYCAQHFTPGAIARIDQSHPTGQMYFLYYASGSDHSSNWNSGGAAFYCVYDAVQSGWKSSDGKTWQVALGGSGQAAPYNGGLNALQPFDNQATADRYCAQYFTPNDVVRRDNLVTTNNYPTTGKTYYVTSHSSDYNYSGAGAYYCLHDVLAAGWVDRDTLASSASAGSTAFGPANPRYNYDDAVKSCGSAANVVWVLEGMTHDVNTISHGTTTYYAKSGEAHWQERQQGFDNHYTCVAQLPSPNQDAAAYDAARVASEVPNCVSAFGTCSNDKLVELLGLCMNRKITCTQQQVVLLQAKDSRNFSDAQNPSAGVADCTKAYGTCQNVVVQFLSDQCTNNKVSCTSLQRQLLAATSQAAFNQLANPPGSGLAGTIGGVTGGLVGGITGAASALHLDQVLNFAQGSSTFTTFTMVEKRAGKTIGIVLDITKAGVISNDGHSFTMSLPNGMNLIGHDGTSLITNDGGSVVASGAGNLITNDGGSIISNDGASLITNDGGSLVARAVSAMIAQDPSAFIGHNGSTLLGPGGASGVISGSGSLSGTQASDSLIGQDGAGAVSSSGSAIVSFPMGAGGSFSVRSFSEASNVDVYRTFQAAMRACGDVPGEKLSQAKTAFALKNTAHGYALLTDVPLQRWPTLQIRGYVCTSDASTASPPWRHVPNP